jgi:hypothetical protein
MTQVEMFAPPATVVIGPDPQRPVLAITMASANERLVVHLRYTEDGIYVPTKLELQRRIAGAGR